MIVVRGKQPQHGMTVMEWSPPGKELLENKNSSHYAPADMSSHSLCFIYTHFRYFFFLQLKNGKMCLWLFIIRVCALLLAITKHHRIFSQQQHHCISSPLCASSNMLCCATASIAPTSVHGWSAVLITSTKLSRALFL